MTRYYPEGKIINDEKNLKFISSKEGLISAKISGEVLETIALSCDESHNIVVDLGGIKGIIPRNEGAVGIKENTVRDIALISRVGKPVCFTVSEFIEDDFGKPAVILSRLNAQKKCQAEYINNLQLGDIIDAKITHLENFGAFCDIGCGIVALLPIDSISVSRINHPGDRFLVGQSIKAVVKAKDSAGRITLSLKELLGSWEENASQYLAGQTVSGVIRSVEDYGIFVELAPNLAGLAEPKSGVKVGQTASVYIKSLIPEKMKVKLIIIDSFSEFTFSPEIRYFYDGDRIDRWQYSPVFSNKNIYTDFS